MILSTQTKYLHMDIYLKLFNLVVPFDNDVTQVFGGVPYEFWKRYGFDDIKAPHEILSSVMCQSTSLVRKLTSNKLGAYTLSDFNESTRPGDETAIYTFSVISSDARLVNRTIEDILPSFESYVKKNSDEGYSLTEPQMTIFPFEKDGVPEDKMLERWENLIQKIPYVDILFQHLLINRHYPEVQVLQH